MEAHSSEAAEPGFECQKPESRVPMPSLPRPQSDVVVPAWGESEAGPSACPLMSVLWLQTPSSVVVKEPRLWSQAFLLSSYEFLNKLLKPLYACFLLRKTGLRVAAIS